MTRRLARNIVYLIVVLTLVFGYFIKDIKFNYVFEDFFPVDDPELAYYQQFKKKFGQDNDYLLIGLTHEPSIFDSVFLSKVNSLTLALDSLQDIEYIKSITTIERPIISPAGLFLVPFVHPSQTGRLKTDSIRIYKDSLLIESIVSPSGKSTALLLKHRNLTQKENAEELIAAVESQLKLLDFEETYIAGKIYAQGVFVEKMQKELVLFLSLSIVLVILFLAWAYKSWWGVLIPLLVVLIATVWITGLMAIMGKSLDILMVLLPTIMFVVGMSDVVHIMTKYIEQLRLGTPKLQALSITVKEVGLATFLTSLTTSVGFLTLITASIAPIQEFGIYTAIGVFFAYLVAFSLLPACLFFLGKPKVSNKLVNRSAWFGTLSLAFIGILRNGKAIIIGAIGIGVLSVAGLSTIVINTYLIEDLPNDAPLKQSFLFFDKNFGGSRPFEMTITVNEGSVFDSSVIKEIHQVEGYLKTHYKAGNVVSPATLVKGLNQAINGGSHEAFALPDHAKDWKTVNKYLKRGYEGKFDLKLVSKDQKTGRITARIGDIGSRLSLARTDSLNQYIEQHIDADIAQFKVTGTSNLIDKNNEYLARNMFEGLAIAFAVVALIAGLMFKSFRMIIITLLPNIIPLLMVAGIMGVFGITLKLSTSIIFTIAFGIAVDDTIHFISKLQIELRKKKSVLYALKRTYLSTGKAIIVTSLILSGGFLTLLFSSFGGTFYTGLLVSLTLIFALLIDLTLLPVLILYFYKR